MQIDYPKSRMDNFFAKAAGSALADDSMEPQTDREYWVNQMAAKIAEGGGGGGGDSIFEEITNTVDVENESIEIGANYNEIVALIQQGKIPYTVLSYTTDGMTYNIIDFLTKIYHADGEEMYQLDGTSYLTYGAVVPTDNMVATYGGK